MSFKSGTLSSRQISPNGVPKIEVSTDFSRGMSDSVPANSDDGASTAIWLVLAAGGGLGARSDDLSALAADLR